MTSNRREFLRKCAVTAPLVGLPALASVASAADAPAKPAPAAGQGFGRLLLNHVGFVPAGAKTVIGVNPAQSEFVVAKVEFNGQRVTLRAVFTGTLEETTGDMGRAWVGDFSAVREEGIYVVHCGQVRSRRFMIQKRLFDYPLRVLFNYFPSQRCGDSLTGYNAPCHEHDGKRVDNHEHLDVSGGWHQSCDCRKWMLGTPFGLLGLTRLGVVNHPRWDRGQIEEELRWGNGYFFKMIRPDGGLMDHVVVPLGWDKERDLYPNDAPLPAFYLTIVGEAMTADYFKTRDPKHAAACLDMARKLWNYVNRKDAPMGPYKPPLVPPFHDFLHNWFQQQYSGSALALGDSVYAAWWLHKATGAKEFLDAACRDATRLCELQIGGDVEKDPAAACFREAAGKTELAMATYYGFFGALGLCELAQTADKHPDRPRWMDAIRRMAEQCCVMAKRNLFGLIPSYWYEKDPGPGRKAGSAFYGYFYNAYGMRMGVNHEVLGKTLFLLRAYSLLGQRRYLLTATRQLDWVLGCNAFDMSTVEGVGYNQPERLISAEFFPATPQIPGAVMSGIIGDDSDEPLSQGWISHEYDMPPTALLMWVMAELQEISA